MSVTPAIYEFSDPAVQVDRYPIYEELRREAPVFWDGPYWQLSRYDDDIVAILNDPRAVVRAAAQTAVLTTMQWCADLRLVSDRVD